MRDCHEARRGNDGVHFCFHSFVYLAVAILGSRRNGRFCHRAHGGVGHRTYAAKRIVTRGWFSTGYSGSRSGAARAGRWVRNHIAYASRLRTGLVGFAVPYRVRAADRKASAIRTRAAVSAAWLFHFRRSDAGRRLLKR
jgi:hypothetical protein